MRRSVLVIVATFGLTLVGSMVYGARSDRLAARAERLLSLLKLVDGAGSGLDADSVQGLAPEQLASVTADRLAMLEARIRELEKRPASGPQEGDPTAALETRIRELEKRLSSMSLADDGKTLRFAGVNVQIVSGAGRTDESNGLGNLIVGYNESQDDVCIDPYDDDRDDCGGARREGSHNIIVGRGHHYRSFGGLVAGEFNTIRAPYASICGGAFNVAYGTHTSVTGGAHNVAIGAAAAVSGGFSQAAEGELSWIGGGAQNKARAFVSAVAGGYGNAATGPGSSVSGGTGNGAHGLTSSVSGGADRDASGESDWAAGGLLEDR